MGAAIALATLDAGALAPGDLLVLEPDPARFPPLAERSVACFTSPESARDALARAEAAPGDAMILLAVKPQSLDAVAAQLRPVLEIPRLILSILAGATLARLAGALGSRHRIVRAMPNTPARIRRGVTAICPSPHVASDDLQRARAVLSPLGEAHLLPESLMDAFTALVGSGPAYLFYLTECLAHAARAAGFAPDLAESLSRATVVGAAALLDAEPERSPASLRASVTSKGGTTEAACRVLDDAGLREIFVRASLAARDRGRELSVPPG